MKLCRVWIGLLKLIKYKSIKLPGEGVFYLVKGVISTSDERMFYLNRKNGGRNTRASIKYNIHNNVKSNNNN